MGTQYGPNAENFFDFFQKISSHFCYGVRNHRICPYFLSFFNFSFFRQNHSPLLILWGHAKSTLVKINSRQFSLHISVGDYLTEFQRWFFKTFSKIYPPTFQVGTEIKRFGVISIKFFKYFPLPSL